MLIYKATELFFRVGDHNVKSSKGLFFSPEVATGHNEQFLEETAEKNGLPIAEIRRTTLPELQENPGFVPGPGVISETHCQLGEFRWILRVAETTVNKEAGPRH